TRTDVPFSVARLRQEGRLTEITGDSLRWSAADAAAFVTGIWPEADGATVDAITSAAVGNPGALRAATHLARRLSAADREAAIRCLTASDGDLAVAAVGELVAALDPSTRRLLDDLVVLREASLAELDEYGHGADP